MRPRRRGWSISSARTVCGPRSDPTPRHRVRRSIPPRSPGRTPTRPRSPCSGCTLKAARPSRRTARPVSPRFATRREAGAPGASGPTDRRQLDRRGRGRAAGGDGVADADGTAAILALQIGCTGDPADQGDRVPAGCGRRPRPDVLATEQATPALAGVVLPQASPTIAADLPDVCGRAHRRRRPRRPPPGRRARGRHGSARCVDERRSVARHRLVVARPDRRGAHADRWRRVRCVGDRAASRPIGSTSLTRALRRLALVAAAALLPIVGPGQLHGACAAGQVQIAVVVDFGTGRSVSAACVGAGTRDNGATVLAARASQLGTPLPRYNASGLVCAIDGYPSEGCGDQTGGHYAYWSYWHGDASGWTYANVGPAGSRAQPGMVEGWRFQPAGAANPTDPAPRGSPIFWPPPAKPLHPPRAHRRS